MILLLVAISIGDCAASNLQQQRKDFQSARMALKRGNATVFDSLAQRLKDYPLYPYLLYLKLRRQPVNASAITRYSQRFNDLRYSGVLNDRLSVYYAQAGQWSRFLGNYRQSSDTVQQCYYYRALYASGRDREAAEGARTLWLSADSRPSECDALFARWRKSASFSSEWTWQRIRLAMTSGNTGLASYLVRSLAASDRNLVDFWLDIHRTPAKMLQCSYWRRRHPRLGLVFAHGVDRLAEDDLERALSVWDRRRSEFDLAEADIARIDRRLGMSLALRHRKDAFERLQRVAPEHHDADSRAWRVRAAVYWQNWPGVLSAIDNLTDREKSALKWRYWRARALQGQGNSVQAEEILRKLAMERDYYGFLAADRLGTGYAFSDIPIVLKPAELAAFQRRPDIQMVREFFNIGMDGQAIRQWWYSIKNMSMADRRVAARVAQIWGRTQLAVFTAAKAEAWDDLGLRFPLRYTAEVTRYAKQRNLQPSLVLGLIRQESVFEPVARSPAGARGLMQIMPATGRLVARKLGESLKSSNRLLDPGLNVRYGTWYLHELLIRFGRNLPMAVAGYNAGPHRVPGWQPRDGRLAADIWVENIPYRETRKYVRYVLSYAQVYQYRLGADQQKMSSLMQTVPPFDPGLRANGPEQPISRCGP